MLMAKLHLSLTIREFVSIEAVILGFCGRLSSGSAPNAQAGRKCEFCLNWKQVYQMRRN
jgi:hypothetical protein